MSLSLPEQIRKRDGRIVPFDASKIVQALSKAAQAVQGADPDVLEPLVERVLEELGGLGLGVVPSVEAVQDVLEGVLIQQGQVRMARSFILYRARRSRIREAKTELMDTVEDILADDVRTGVASSAADKLSRIGWTASTEFALKRMLPEELVEAHLRGEIHLADLPLQAIAPHSVTLPLARLLREGLVAEGGIVPPGSSPQGMAMVTALAIQLAAREVSGPVMVPDLDQAWAHALPGDAFPDLALEEAFVGMFTWLNVLAGSRGGRSTLAILTLGSSVDPLAARVARACLAALERVEPVTALEVRVTVDPLTSSTDAVQAQALRLASTRLQPTFLLSRIESPPLVAARVTLNLVRSVLRARLDGIDLETVLDRQVRLAVRAIRHRIEATSDLRELDQPFLSAHGLPRSSRVGWVSFAGLAEAVRAWTGEDPALVPASREVARAWLEGLVRRLETAAEKHGMVLMLEGSADEEAAARFPALDRRDFGPVAGLTDRTVYGSGASLSPGSLASEGDAHRMVREGAVAVVSLSRRGEDSARLADEIRRAREAGCQAIAFAHPLVACGRCGAVDVPSSGDCPACGSGELTRTVYARIGGAVRAIARLPQAWQLAFMPDDVIDSLDRSGTVR